MSQKLERLSVSEHNDKLDETFGTTTNSISTNKIKSNMTPILEYERSSRKLLDELRLKRNLLENYQMQLDKALMTQHELRKQLENERCMSKKINIEYTRIRDKVIKLETDLLVAREDAAKSKMYRELMEKENKTLKEQNLQLQTENNIKARKIDELANCLEHSSIGYDNKTVKQLEITQRQFQAVIDELQELSNQVKSHVLLNYEKYSEKYEQLKYLQQKLVTLSRPLENYNEISTSLKNLKDSNISEEKNQIETLQNDLEAERNVNSVLTTIMNNMIQQLTNFQQQENESKHTLEIFKNQLLCDNRVTSILINQQTVDVSTQTI